EGCEFWFGAAHAPHFYSWVFPKRDYVDLGTGSTNGKSLKDLMEKFKARRRVFGNGRQKVYRLPLKWRDSLVTKNILFIGDAAGLVMPFSYEGIYYAMSSGKIAAEAVISGRPKDYEKKWRKKYLKQFQLMMGLKKYFLRNDTSMEYMVNLHKNKEVQDASIRLWYGKEFSPSVFLKYAAYFVKYLN
ncbi:MAG: hypothetical protein HY758_00965, partial [Nitrospirae bacterium]|nr:hypothetical protein [Nitrospirota bacterium]